MSVSVTSWCSTKTEGQHNLLTITTLHFKEIQLCTKITVHQSGTFFLNSGLRKFRHGISIVERAMNLARERWMLRV